MTPNGFKFAGTRCGLKNKRNDVGLIVSDRPARAAAVLTQNLVRAACIDHSRAALADGTLRAVVVNSGNANCCTGEQGVRDVERTVALAAETLGLEPAQIVVSSTGVIGQPLDMTKLEKGVREAATKLTEDMRPFMEAILTTDLVEKWAHWQEGTLTQHGDDQMPVGDPKKPRILGICKGSGMIAPNMATMLGFIVTDYDVSGIDLDATLRAAVAESFNATTVDGDTSTNDMVLVMANGANRTKADPLGFRRALTEVCVSLAKQIARDGEGATKLVEVRVTGSADPARVARTIADSPLVKTAMYGCDPNWGRIMAAAGRSGVAFDVAQARLEFEIAGERHLLFEGGTPAVFDPAKVSAALKAEEVVIDLQLDGGQGDSARVFTCDLSYGYVRINAEYHT